VSTVVFWAPETHRCVTGGSLGGMVTLTVEDDGLGLPETWQKGQGLGTRIMAHRAAMIGAAIALEPNPTGGTLVRCSFPLAPPPVRPNVASPV